MGAAFCANHSFEMAEDLCGQCGRDYCPECLIYPYGTNKAPLCKSCAIAMAGIRKHAGAKPAMSRRELRRRRRERRAEAAKGGGATPPLLVPPTDWGAATEPAFDDRPPPPEVVPAATAEDGAEDWGSTFDRGLARLR